MKAISFNGGISGTNTVLVDAATICSKISLNIINFKINTEAQETHELCWREDFVQLT